MARHLIHYCGGVEAVFKSSKNALLNIPGVRKTAIDFILKCNPEKLAAAEIEFLEKHKVKALFFSDDDFPSRLKHFSNAPLMLYYRGTANLNHDRIVSIVGTRKPTEHGKAICEELVDNLMAYDVLVVSGLAYGIDVTAHKKSLSLNIPNIGVLGHGLKTIYPSSHRLVAERMLQCGGLLTEYTSDIGPEREHFPMRNRIVAGLADALIVVETAKKGGSIITAELANQYNKDVFAVPGRLKDANSKGCNHLIKSHKAALIESAEDIAYVMRWESSKEQRMVQQALFAELTELSLIHI